MYNLEGNRRILSRKVSVIMLAEVIFCRWKTIRAEFTAAMWRLSVGVMFFVFKKDKELFVF